LIENQGGSATHFPVLSFAPPQDTTAFQEAVNQLGEQDWLIFVSPRAVYACIPLLRRRWPELPPHVQFVAIGAGTAAALRAAGYHAAIQPEQEWNSEGLLKLPVFQSIQHKKIALIRGEGGRELLAHTLVARGAKVLHVVAYRRETPATNERLLAQTEVNVILCTSVDSLRHFQLLAGAYWPSMQALPLIVVSERIKKLAQDLDFQRIWVAKNASHAAILEILVQKREIICQSKQTKPNTHHDQHSE
jgi:uroporphyrinogen-III synthase